MFNKKLKIKLKEQEDKIQSLNNKIENLNKIENINGEIKEINYQLVDRVNKVEKQIREQTEADLFFISAKIQDELLHGAKKEDLHTQADKQNALQGQLRQMQGEQMAMSYNTNPFLGVLGSLGRALPF